MWRYTAAAAGRGGPRFSAMDYAIIRLGNKQHRVRDGETLVVDRLPTEEGKTFSPEVLLGAAPVTATVLSHERGPKILVGKYRKRTGYKRHVGFRAATTRVEITLSGGAATKRKPASAARTTKAASAKPSVPTPVAAEKPLKAEPRSAASKHVESAAPPEGYSSLTVAQIAAASKEWSRAELEQALAYEHSHQGRKGAIAALSAALSKEDV